jgi:O-antigen/teichoic acid export membrane protein
MNRLLLEWRRVRSSALARNASWMFLGQGFSIVCQGAYFLFLARLLGSTEYGIFVGVAAMVSILSQYSTLGMYSVFLRYVCPAPSNFARYWGNVIMANLVLGTCFVVLLGIVGPRVAHSFSVPMVVCVAISDCLLAQFTQAAGRVFQAFEMMKLTAGLTLVTNFLRMVVAGAMLMALRHATAMQWVVATLVISFVAALTAAVLVTRMFGLPIFSLRLLRERLGEGFVFALSYSTGAIYNDIDKAMLGHFGLNAANGVYTTAYRIIDIGTMPFNSIQAAAFPRFFRLGVDGVHPASGYALQIMRRTIPIAIVCAISMFALAPIIPHLVGPSFAESVSALRWLCVIPIFRAFHISAGDALTASGHQQIRLGTQAAVSIFNFCVNLYLIPHFGWHGAAWASLATDGTLVLLNCGAVLGLRSRRAARPQAVVSVNGSR